MSPDPSLHPVRAAREAKGWRLQDLAQAIGRSASMLSNVEHGFLPKPTTCQAIADALGADPHDLWPGEFE